jgi:hypothetical protein
VEKKESGSSLAGFPGGSPQKEFYFCLCFGFGRFHWRLHRPDLSGLLFISRIICKLEQLREREH